MLPIVAESSFWITTLSAVRRSEPEWKAIAHYLEPVTRYLARFHRGVPEVDREDLAVDILVAMQTGLVGRYDRSHGPFRTYLKAAIENRVRSFRRERRTARRDEDVDPDDVAVEAGEAEAAAIDLEAELLRAIRAFHDAHAKGRGDDLALMYCFAGRLVHDRSEEEIARRERLSRDQVKRALSRARGEIVDSLVGSLLERQGGVASGAERARAVELVREGLRRPRDRSRLLDREGAPSVRAAVEELLSAVDAARRQFAEGASEASRELARGLEEVLKEP
jgi:RNA polymerase sigma factor (sigma-70 family)